MLEDVCHRLRGAGPGARSNHLVFLGHVRGERGKTAAATGRSRKGGVTLRPGSRTRTGLLQSGRPRGRGPAAANSPPTSPDPPPSVSDPLEGGPDPRRGGPAAASTARPEQAAAASAPADRTSLAATPPAVGGVARARRGGRTSLAVAHRRGPPRRTPGARALAGRRGRLREPPLVRLVLVQQMQHLQGIHTYGKKRRDPDC
ncbi:hypothetical protein PVAP13_6KG367018 [Panicum virgatum]|uniref:Uncharacterized protein n=1 Tax=Panicum virgatum TaxID=38727 RepID=A0A8T0RG42_PANVG|nr:hypothetical protein PVAP13_6KG367018 [Panicum virgatum]